MNKFMFIGNLTRDPELTATQSGKSRATFHLAVNRRYVKESGEREADFFLIVCYGNTADNAAKYLSKGKKCSVIGEIRTGKYEKEGRTIYTTEYRADEIEFLTPGNGGQAAAQNEGGGETPQHTSAAGFAAVETDDLPF